MSTPPNPNTQSRIKADDNFTLRDAVEVTWYKTSVRMYGLSDEKLNHLISGNDSFALVFFGICVGACITLFIAWQETATATIKPYYFGAFLATLLGGIFSGYLGISGYLRTKQRLRELYSNSVPLEIVPGNPSPTPPSQQ